MLVNHLGAQEFNIETNHGVEIGRRKPTDEETRLLSKSGACVYCGQRNEYTFEAVEFKRGGPLFERTPDYGKEPHAKNCLYNARQSHLRVRDQKYGPDGKLATLPTIREGW